MSIDSTTLSASNAVSLIRQGNLTVEQYAKALLSRIAQRDPIVHAWAYIDPEYVLDQARKLDRVPIEHRGPLHGIPVAIKDIALTKDMPTRYNSDIYRSSHSSSVDAACVITLRAAGALLLGKTHTTEFAATTDGGPCVNPLNIGHTPGGSSSGSAAAVADFQAPIALGTQTGGSIVRPASYTGIYGFKPTWGAISREGLAQYSISCDTPGFFARTIEDLELLTDVYRFEDVAQPEQATEFQIQGARVGFIKTHVWDLAPAGPGLKEVWEKAKNLLIEHGAIVEEIDWPDDDFNKLTDWHWAIINGEGRSAFHGHYTLDKQNLSQFLVDQVENNLNFSREDLLDALDRSARLRPIWDRFSERFEVILTPSAPDIAPEGTHFTGDARFCGPWTLLHVPCLNLPGISGGKSLPIGLTLVSGRYRDRHVLKTGKIIGDIFESTKANS
ncbi:amidase signature domain-containing protein [Talaromyces proteolyticus]|uniref:Amidase signature domain-containing protein n=1 Tax=Talaromyces proteolyticus TaxID=1131652 RepID=A0AAD4KXE5_9EURO|nr:amidase signature domain-containing protein [Talaromyces proteolyticus]KAH8698932.1 amidase signature domain-containing protein [Talaromyces proteolyticus]